MQTSAKKEGESFFARMKTKFAPPHGTCVLIYLVTCAVIGLILFVAAVPERYAIPNPSSTDETVISEVTIKATKDVTDETLTEERREQARTTARNRYANQHHVDKTSLVPFLKDIGDAMAALKQAQQYGAALNAEAEEGSLPAYTREQLTQGRDLTGYPLTNEQVRSLFTMDEAVFDNSVTQISETLSTLIQNDYLSFESPDNALKLIDVELTASTQADPALLSMLKSQGILQTVTEKYWVEDTAYIDEKAREAAELIEDIKYHQGDVIVTENEPVRQNQYDMLESLGLLAGGFDVTLYLGIVMLTVASMAVLYVLLRLLHGKILNDVKRSMLLCVCTVLGVALCAVAFKLFNVYAAPIMLSVILVSTLLGARAGLSCAVSMAILMAGMAGGGNTSMGDMVSSLLMTLLCGTATITFLKTHTQRVRLIICGVMNAVIAAVALAIV